MYLDVLCWQASALCWSFSDRKEFPGRVYPVLSPAGFRSFRLLRLLPRCQRCCQRPEREERGRGGEGERLWRRDERASWLMGLWQPENLPAVFIFHYFLPLRAEQAIRQRASFQGNFIKLAQRRLARGFKAVNVFDAAISV